MKNIFKSLMLLTSLSLYAENTVNLDLNKAFDLAIKNDNTVKKAELTYENSEIDRKKAFKSGLPSISYSGLYMENNGDFNQYKLTLTQPIFNGFKIVTAVKNSVKYTKLSDYLLESTKNSVELQTLKSYITIQKLQNQLEVLNNSKKELDNHYIRINRLYELGLITKTEVLDLNYNIIDLEASIQQVENSLEVSKITLKNSLGIDSKNEITLSPITFNDININNIDFDNDLNNALKNSLNIKIAETNTILTKASETIERANFMPTVALQVNYGNASVIKGSPSNALDEKNIGFTTTISFSGTLFDWGKNIDSYKAVKNNTEKAELDEQSSKNSLELGIKNAYLELLRLDKLINSKNKALESSTENYKLQKQRYENQLINANDFLKAENNLRKAEVDLFNTKLDLYYAYNNYENLLK